MRQLAIILCAAAVLALAAPALAQKTDPGPICKDCDVAVAPTDIDPYIEKFAADLDSFQEAFKAQYGIYAQMLSPFAAVPADGKADLPTDILKYPTSGVTADAVWKVTGLEAFPASIRIDVYDGPRGKGYVLVFDTKFNGQLFTKSINVGPEAYRTTDWQIVMVQP